MGFSVNFYPLYGFLLGANWSKTEFEDCDLHNVEVCLGIILVEVLWESYPD